MRPAAKPRGRGSLVAIGVLTAAIMIGAEWPQLVPGRWLAVQVLNGFVAVLLVVGGTRLASRPGQRTNGRLMLAAGLLFVLESVRWDPGPWAAIGWVSGTMVAVLLAWLLLRYPGDRLTDPYDRVFVPAMFGLVLGLRLLETVLWNPTWGGYDGHAWWPTIGRSQGLHTVNFVVMWLVDVVLGVVFLVLVIRRHRRATGLGRRQAVPLLVAGVVGAIVFGVVNNVVPLVTTFWFQSADDVLNLASSLASVAALLVMMGSFGVAALLEGLQRARVSALLADMDAEHDPEALQRSLRAVLADPGLLLLFRETATDGWIDAGGDVLDLSATDLRQLVPVPERDGAVRVALLVDEGVTQQRDLLGAVVRASRLTLDNARLQALAQARLEEVTRSRQRLASVGLEERRRLERDLHDGAQQRLLSVAAGLATARAATDDPVMHERLDEVRDGLRAALQELRDLANGIHPAVLTQSGLGPAIESAAERLALPARIQVAPRRWPPEVESAAYFVTAEALTNAVKHSGAEQVSVSAASEGADLLLTIVDDGAGGATPTPGSGGLTGMRDRVAALGGTLMTTSPAGGGTTIRARFPCA
ncbi:MAG: sensor histidine kinase [Candidatus Nanopelagicales bacterium]